MAVDISVSVIHNGTGLAFAENAETVEFIKKQESHER